MSTLLALAATAVRAVSVRPVALTSTVAADETFARSAPRVLSVEPFVTMTVPETPFAARFEAY